MMKSTYFSDTTPISDQNVSERMPRMLSPVGRTPCAPNASCNAYRGTGGDVAEHDPERRHGQYG